MSRVNFPSRKKFRKQYALERQASVKTPQQQLEKLDMLFGVGLGAVKERAKLAKRMSKMEDTKVEDDATKV